MYSVPRAYTDSLCVLKGTTDAMLERYENDEEEIDYDVIEAIGKLNTALKASYFKEADD